MIPICELCEQRKEMKSFHTIHVFHVLFNCIALQMHCDAMELKITGTTRMLDRLLRKI